MVQVSKTKPEEIQLRAALYKLPRFEREFFLNDHLVVHGSLKNGNFSRKSLLVYYKKNPLLVFS